MTTLNLPVLNILAESAARSLALGLLMAAGLRLLRVRHARLEKQAWAGVLLLALAMPLLVALNLPRITLPAAWVAPIWSQPQMLAVPNRTAAVHSRTASPSLAPSGQEAAMAVWAAPVPAALQGPATGPATGLVRHQPFPWALFGFMVYALGSALLLLRLATGLVLATRLWRRAEVFETDQTLLPVRLTAELDSPVTLGRGILLPLEAAAWDAATLRTTLAHEAAHVQAGDFYLQLAASLHLALFWISPLAWWLPAQLSRLGETICDRAAVETAGDGLAYAQLLLRFASSGRAPAGMLAMAQPAGLPERIERLIADPQLAGAFRQRRGQAAAALVLLSVAGMASAATVRILASANTVLAVGQAPALPTSQTSPASPAPPAPQTSTPLPTVTPATDADGKPIPSSEPAVSPDTQVEPLAPLDRVVPLESPSDGDSFVENDDAKGSHYAIFDTDGNGSSVIHGPFGDAAAWRALRDRHPGGAIWFERDGKPYVIEDPALVKQARDAYAPVQQLGKQQGALGEKQGALGDQQGRIGELQGEIGEKQGEWGEQQAALAEKFDFKMPDGFDAAVAKLTEASTRLAFEGDSLDKAQREALEAQQKEAQANFDKLMAEFKAQQPQREVWEKQVREQSEQIRKQMGPMLKQMKEFAAKQGEFAKQQAELGRQQALLGREQAKASREANQKVQQLIDQAVRDGKARPAP
jgi:bla regulator protein blaR1